MTIEGEASLPPSSTTIVYANQKSGGPRVFGALAMLLGALGVVMALIENGADACSAAGEDVVELERAGGNRTPSSAVAMGPA